MVIIINVYTDGACSNNQNKSKARAGLGVFFGDGDNRNLSKRIEGKQTNNVAELSAFREVYRILSDEIKKGRKVNVHSDSIYSIRAVGEYGKKNENSGWKNNIANRELVREMYELFKPYPNVKFIYVKAHTKLDDIHSLGNAAADALAREALKNDK